MKYFITKQAFLITALLISNTALFGQQRTGNIVEYFGKEKVEEVNEGDVVHVFKKGLAIQLRELGFNSSSFPEDPVYEQFLMKKAPQVKEGDVFDVDQLGNVIVWNEILVDSTNTFSGNALRSGYVYLNYKSNAEKIVLFEASGHSLVSINGFPHEGDHYDFGYNLIPIKLKKGENVFVLKVGRFPRVRARILQPHNHIQFTTRDLTMPDILMEEDAALYGAIRVINNTEEWIKGFTVNALIEGKNENTKVPNIPPLSVYKIPVSIPGISGNMATDKTNVVLQLLDSKGHLVTSQEISLNVKSKFKHHKRTFISDIDGSVQYYSVAPASDKDIKDPALFLSVHGASVEAVNQANAYQQKDWGHLVAPTNRRPFGFAWEDWGRLDALEVLAEAKSIYKPDSKRIYLTGHSMGGHGTWYLGATYPDHFAAIAPCAGYPDLLAYRDSFKDRMNGWTDVSDKVLERLMFEPTPTPVEKMLTRAGTPSRTLKLIRNYLHHGVYILHGEKDNVVPTYLAQDMRERLGTFHPDFTYYEYPDGTHWYGNHSVDWKPIFDFFEQRSIKDSKEIKQMEFSTGSPGVSSGSHYVSIHQQTIPFDISSFKLSKGGNVAIETNNVALLSVDLNQIEDTINQVVLNGKTFDIANDRKAYFKVQNGEWDITSPPSAKEKGPHRNGGFKDAFRNNVVFVYATKGSKTENDWYFNKAKFDAETFWYKANGKIELVADVDFNLKKYANRNVVVYGNRDNNSAWNKLLKDSPIQVSNNAVLFGDKKVPGDQWGTYFIVPRADSDTASIGVVSATGEKGMKAIYANHYLVNGTTFPDVVIFDDTVLSYGAKGIKCTGFFGNDWSVEKGDFEWK